MIRHSPQNSGRGPKNKSMKVLIVSCSKNGYELGEKVRKEWILHEPFLEAEHIVKTKMLPELSVEGKMEDYVREHFTEYDVLLFICATGIAVRAIAPVLKHKSLDPAVVVLDDQARHVISLLSGHAGGANQYTHMFAAMTGADPVITTASDLEGKFAVDVFARDNGLVVANWKTAKFISVEILSGKGVGLLSDYPLEGDLPEGIVPYEGQEDLMYIHITDQKKEKGNDRCLKLIVPDLILGIGCRKDTPQEMIEEAVASFMNEQELDLRAVKAIQSIDIKADEPGLLAFAEKHKIPFRTFSAEILNQLEGEFSQSEFVESVTGVSSVCERAAVAEGGELIVKKTKYPQVTLAAARIPFEIRF